MRRRSGDQRCARSGRQVTASKRPSAVQRTCSSEISRSTMGGSKRECTAAGIMSSLSTAASNARLTCPHLADATERLRAAEPARRTATRFERGQGKLPGGQMTAPPKERISRKELIPPVSGQGDGDVLSHSLAQLERGNCGRVTERYARVFHDALQLSCAERGIRDLDLDVVGSQERRGLFCDRRFVIAGVLEADCERTDRV